MHIQQNITTHYRANIIYIFFAVTITLFFLSLMLPKTANAQIAPGCSWQLNSSGRYAEWVDMCPADFTNLNAKNKVCSLALVNAFNKYPRLKCNAPCLLFVKETHIPSCNYWSDQQQQGFFNTLRRAIPGFNDSALRWQPGENYYTACSVSISAICGFQNPGIGWKGPIP